MMEITVMPVGAYQTNCYMVWDESRDDCVLIDPGYEPEWILQQVKAQNKTVAAILLTHGHFDHVGGVREIAKVTDCAVYMRPEERQMPGQMTAGDLYSTHCYGDTVEEAGLSFTVLHTPGHTPGSVCLIADGVIFSGDTLFAGSRGRTDFPGGDEKAIAQSLQILAALPGDYQVLPGHAEATTLSFERKNNPFM